MGRRLILGDGILYIYVCCIPLVGKARTRGSDPELVMTLLCHMGRVTHPQIPDL